jgi:hypothetical protein
MERPLITSSRGRVSVVDKMLWASKRTSQIEDQAYCLLRLFSINMSLLYSEGKKAFLRLQKIIKDDNDISLFAWDASEIGEQEHLSLFGLFTGLFCICWTSYHPPWLLSCRLRKYQSLRIVREIVVFDNPQRASGRRLPGKLFRSDPGG